MRPRFAFVQGRASCTPARLIKNSPQTEITRHRNGDTGDIIETILWMDAHSSEWVVTENVECLRGASDYDTLHNVWQFVKHNIRYQPDRPGHERVKSPGALFTNGVGDCKSMSIAEGALLRALGIPYKFRFAAYDSGDYTHVYVVADTNGDDVILDAVHSVFDEEVRYKTKKDIRPVNAVAGIGKMPATASKNFAGLIVIGLFAYLIFK